MGGGLDSIALGEPNTVSLNKIPTPLEAWANMYSSAMKIYADYADTGFKTVDAGFKFMEQMLRTAPSNSMYRFWSANDSVIRRTNSSLSDFFSDKERIKEIMRYDVTVGQDAIDILCLYDSNPMHNNIEIASKGMFKGIVGQGIMAHLLADYVLPHNERVFTSAKTKFVKPVRPGDKLEMILEETTPKTKDKIERTFLFKLVNHAQVSEKNPEGLVTLIEYSFKPHNGIVMLDLKKDLKYASQPEDYHILPTFAELKTGEVFYNFKVPHDFRGNINKFYEKVGLDVMTPNYFNRREVSGIVLQLVESMGLGVFEPGAGTVFLGSSFEQKQPVYPGDSLDITLRTTEKIEPGRKIGYELSVANQDSRRVYNSSGIVMLDPARDTHFL